MVQRTLTCEQEGKGDNNALAANTDKSKDIIVTFPKILGLMELEFEF